MYKERISTVSERLKEAMKIKGMRQIDLCNICKIPKGAMSLYISGAYEPKQDRLQDIAIALGVDIAWLMGYDTSMAPMKERNSPEEHRLTEGERLWLELYRRVSPDTRNLLIKLVDSFDGISEEKQKLALQLIRVAFGDLE